MPPQHATLHVCHSPRELKASKVSLMAALGTSRETAWDPKGETQQFGLKVS